MQSTLFATHHSALAGHGSRRLLLGGGAQKMPYHGDQQKNNDYKDNKAHMSHGRLTWVPGT